MKPSVLHLRASNFVGGPEKQILRYATACNQVETIVGVFCGNSEGKDLLREAAGRGIATLELPAHSVVQAVRTLKRAVRESNVHLLCAHGYKPAVVAALVSRLTGVPYTCFLRGWTKENPRVAVYEAIERFCLRGASRVVCLSRTQASRLSRIYKARTRVVVNAIDRRTFTADERRELKNEICALVGLDSSRPLAVAAGRLSPEKGTSVLVQAAEILRVACPELQFTIFGDGVERTRIAEQISTLGLDSSVRLAGHNPNFSNLVAGADLLVNPSLTEEMPNVVLEAMSAGVPIVATAVGGVPELGENGAMELVAANDAKALADGIEHLLSNPALRTAMIQRAYERLQHEFSPERQAEQISALYGEFVAVGRVAAGSRLPRISVVIPVRNEEQGISDVLNAFCAQDYPPELFEIVVSDGLSQDRTAQVVAQCASRSPVAIRLVQNPGRLSSCGRNVGVAAATGEVIIFSDGHCHVPGRVLLRDIADLFSRTGAGILCRPQPLEVPGNTNFQQVVAAARASWLGHGRDSTIYSIDFEGWVDPSSAGALYRRSLFEQFGGFDEDFDACEDVEFNYRLHHAGIKAYISPKLTIFYEPRKSLASLFRQMVRYGRGRVRLARKHPGAGSLSQLVPATLVLLVMIGPLLAFTPLSRIWLLLVGGYTTVVLAESLRVSLRRGGRNFFMLPLAFMAIHAGLGAGFIREWFARKRSHSRVPVIRTGAPDEHLELTAGKSSPQEIGSR